MEIDMKRFQENEAQIFKMIIMFPIKRTSNCQSKAIWFCSNFKWIFINFHLIFISNVTNLQHLPFANTKHQTHCAIITSRKYRMLSTKSRNGGVIMINMQSYDESFNFGWFHKMFGRLDMTDWFPLNFSSNIFASSRI